jgi:hypothetical protein
VDAEKQLKVEEQLKALKNKMNASGNAGGTKATKE